MCSCSGPFGSTIEAGYKVLQAWSETVNAAGGLGGHPVDLIEKDDASSPATSASDAQALVSDKVSAIVDLDILDEVWQKLASSADIPVIGGNISATQFYTDPDWYPAGETNDSIAYATVATAKTAGGTKLGMLYCAEAASCAEAVPLVKSIATTLSVPVVYTGPVAATAPNYTAQCLAAKQAGVDTLFVSDSTPVVARVASDCDKQGYDPIYVTEGTGYQSTSLTTPGLESNLWSSFPVLPYYSTAPAVTAMNTSLDKYFPGLRQDNLTWSEFAVQAWTAGLLLQDAATNAGVTTGTDVTAATLVGGLDKVSNSTLGGFSPALTFVAGKPHSVDCWYTGHVHGGVAAQVGGQTCHAS